MKADLVVSFKDDSW